MNLKRNIKDLGKSLLNLPGWRTNRKIIVFQSDDWGSIRMPSRDVYETLVKKGIRIDKLPYNCYDSLASEEDLTALFEALSSVKDKYGNPAVITANTIVTNPDFNKIHDSNFREYFFELFTDTLKRYPKHEKSFELWKEGMEAGVFKPQFHGREHLNVKRWMSSLQNNTGNIRLAFDYGMFDLSDSFTVREDSFMETFNLDTSGEIDFQKKAIVEGTQLFKEIFGYTSKTFIAPCYIWSSELNQTLKESGIIGIQGVWVQFEPKPGKTKHKKIIHYTGQKNKLNQIFMVRNVGFEPSLMFGNGIVKDALERIKTAFLLRKPAIITAHRLNFIGFINEKNRIRNLKLLKDLLREILKKWPDVEFISSDQLVELIIKE